MNIDTRKQVYGKFNGRCAYCGRAIEYKDMQVDHMVPQRSWDGHNGGDDISNLYPSCRRCNHYKRGNSLKTYRKDLLEMEHKVFDTYLGKVAVDYGMATWNGWDGKFYFEKQRSVSNEH